VVLGEVQLIFSEVNPYITELLLLICFTPDDLQYDRELITMTREPHKD